MSSAIQLIFGGGSFMIEGAFSLTDVQEMLDILQEGGVKAIDTATIYQESEEILGKVKASTRFSIDTKFPGGFSPEPATAENINATAQASLQKLQTDELDVYYLHAPDRGVPLETTLEAMNSLQQAGKFKRLGLSNFLPEEVEEAVRIAKDKNYVIPSVYQGNYNAVARRVETELLPTLRKHNISFYAYSPIAGGFLTKSVEQLLSGGEGRWDPKIMIGRIYNSLYNKPQMLEGLRLWEEISQESGIPKAELAYRWIVNHSALEAERGDAVIFGSRNNEQLRQTLAGLKNGPLAPEIVSKIEQVWEIVEAESPLDNFNSLLLSGSDGSNDEKR